MTPEREQEIRDFVPDLSLISKRMPNRTARGDFLVHALRYFEDVLRYAERIEAELVAERATSPVVVSSYGHAEHRRKVAEAELAAEQEHADKAARIFQHPWSAGVYAKAATDGWLAEHRERRQ